jgi:hypothetical protein
MVDKGTVQGKGSNRWLVIMPLGIAVLSLVSSISQSWNYSRNIESAQQNVLKAESLRTCRDIIDIFFQFRLKTVESHIGQQSISALDSEMKAIVYRFGAYGTFLANFQDEEARKRYTELSRDMLSVAENATKLSKADVDARFTRIDERFGKLNDDCVKAAQSRLL